MKTNVNAVLLFAIAVLPASALARDLDETWSLSAEGKVSVSNVAGEIVVTTWDRNEVHLTGYLGNDQELEITENSQGLVIEVVDSTGDYDESELHLVIPRTASVSAEGVSADISITECNGVNVSAESVSGDIDVEADSDRVDVSSVSGDVDFKGTSSRTTVESVSGDISIEGVSGEISITTVSGDAELVAGSVKDGKFNTVSGTLELSLSATEGGNLRVESMSGDVEMLLPQSQSGTFSAQSFSGDIDTDFGKVKYESFGPGSHLKHIEGDSGAAIRIESFSGDILIGHK